MILQSEIDGKVENFNPGNLKVGDIRKNYRKFGTHGENKSKWRSC